MHAQRLDRPRPTDLRGLVKHLAVVQMDLTAAVAPSADLVCWSRLGAAYALGDLDRMLVDRRFVDLQGFVRPAEDLSLFRAEMAAWPGREPLRDWQMDSEDWVDTNDDCRRDILELLRAEGPLPARALPDSCVMPWRSTGWRNNRNVVRMLDFLEARGEVAVSSREGRERLWDVADRVYPETPTVPWEDAAVEQRRRRLAALGVARARTTVVPGEPWDVGEVGEEVVVEGVPGPWRVDPVALDRLGEPFRGRTALLSPLDRLVVDRRRLAELFGFDYQLEMYKPAARRRWGYWAMPILSGDRLVGKLDATADRAAGVLRVDAVHEDVPFSRTVQTSVDREIRALGALLDLEVVAG